MLKNNYSTIFNSKLNFLVDTSYITQKMKSKSLPFADVGICRHPANRKHLEKKARQIGRTSKKTPADKGLLRWS